MKLGIHCEFLSGWRFFYETTIHELLINTYKFDESDLKVDIIKPVIRISLADSFKFK